MAQSSEALRRLAVVEVRCAERCKAKASRTPLLVAWIGFGAVVVGSVIGGIVALF